MREPECVCVTEGTHRRSHSEGTAPSVDTTSPWGPSVHLIMKPALKVSLQEQRWKRDRVWLQWHVAVFPSQWRHLTPPTHPQPLPAPTPPTPSCYNQWNRNRICKHTQSFCLCVCSEISVKYFIISFDLKSFSPAASKPDVQPTTTCGIIKTDGSMEALLLQGEAA